MQSGDLKTRVKLQRKGAAAWEDQGEAYAHLRWLRGSETVLAGRLAGRNTVVISLRSGALTRAAETSWRIKDATTFAVFDIKSIIPGDDFTEFTCLSGSPG